MMNRIEMVTTDKYEYIDILLVADPSWKAIDCYLDESDLFVMFEGDVPVCAAAVLQISKSTCELKNIAVTKLRRGYGSKMVGFICEHYKDKYKFMLVGTADTSTHNIRFYEANGFAKTHQIDNFFIDNYDEPIYEDGLQCKHMVMLKKKLGQIGRVL